MSNFTDYDPVMPKNKENMEVFLEKTEAYYFWKKKYLQLEKVALAYWEKRQKPGVLYKKMEKISKKIYSHLNLLVTQIKAL